MSKPISPSAMDALWDRAEAMGYPRTSAISRMADFSAGCQSPVMADFHSHEDELVWFHRRHPKTGKWRFHGGASHLNATAFEHQKKPCTSPRRYFTAYLPCRKCEVCLKRRASQWRARAKKELLFSTRTWFGTLTVNPYERVKIDIRARCRHHPTTSDELFKARHAEISREITLYFKRLRKEGAKLRYLLVAEQHKDGWPHYHCLIHEKDTPITKRLLQSHWLIGFSSFKLVDLFDQKVAYYVTKYISKQALARIRASLKYGTDSPIVKAFYEMLQRDKLIPKGNGGSGALAPALSLVTELKSSEGDFRNAECLPH